MSSESEQSGLLTEDSDGDVDCEDEEDEDEDVDDDDDDDDDDSSSSLEHMFETSSAPEVNSLRYLLQIQTGRYLLRALFACKCNLVRLAKRKRLTGESVSVIRYPVDVRLFFGYRFALREVDQRVRMIRFGGRLAIV